MNTGSYLKLVSGSRVTNYMGLVMDEGVPFKYGKHYLSIQVPVRIPEDLIVKRGQQIFIAAACTLAVRGEHLVEVEPSVEFHQFGTVSPGYKIDPGTEKHQPGVWLIAHKSLDLSTIDFAVKLYLIT